MSNICSKAASAAIIGDQKQPEALLYLLISAPLCILYLSPSLSPLSSSLSRLHFEMVSISSGDLQPARFAFDAARKKDCSQIFDLSTDSYLIKEYFGFGILNLVFYLTYFFPRFVFSSQRVFYGKELSFLRAKNLAVLCKYCATK